MTREEAIELKKLHSDFLLSLRGVVGVGITEDDSGSYGLLVHLEDEDDELVRRIRDGLSGHSVKFERTGRYRKF